MPDQTRPGHLQGAAFRPLVAGVLIPQDERFLVLQHASPPTAYGLWGWPAGLVHGGESLEAAAVREAKEETNLDVRIDGRVAIYQARTEDFVKHLFVGTVVGGALCADRSEILSAAWLSRAEIQRLAEEAQLRGRWVVDGVRDYLGRHSREDGAKPTPAGS